MLDNELEARFNEILEALKGLRENGSLTENFYYKSLLCISYEYAMLDELEKAKELIELCSVEYFREVFPYQMESDKEFEEVAYTLALKFDKAGMSSIKLFPNSTPPKEVN